MQPFEVGHLFRKRTHRFAVGAERVCEERVTRGTQLGLLHVR